MVQLLELENALTATGTFYGWEIKLSTIE